MASNDWPEWLPADWSMQIAKIDKRKVKCYLDPEGRKFYSKPQVDRHLKSLNSSTVTEKTNNGGGSTVDLSLEPDVPHTNEVPPSTPRPRGRPRKLTTGSSNKKSEGDKSSTEPDKSQKYEASEVEKNKTQKKTEGGCMYSDYELISSTPADGLPPGWVKEIRVRNHGAQKKKDPYYLDPLSGYIFLSKLDALRYLESGDIKNCAMRPLRRDMNEADYHNAEGELASPPDPSKGSETSKVLPNGTKESDTMDKRKVRSLSGDGYISTPNASQKNETSEWQLPEGWVMEVNVRNSGTKYKCFKESATGRKFYSKPQVLSYLGNVNSSNSRKRKGRKSSGGRDSSRNFGSADVKRLKGSGKKKTSILNSNYNEVIATSPADGLPPGWVKEIRTKKYATHERKDPYYTDPSTGYIFRSKLDALRFLETGDVNLCAIRPKVKDADGNEIFVPAHNGAKPVKTPTRKQHFKGEDKVEVKRQKGSKKKKKSILNSNFREVISTSPADGLPPGWVKEIRTKKYATHERKDPYYTDPSTGYIFRSKLDALRFLETGDVNLCAIRPKMKDANGNEIFVPAPDGAKPVKTPTRKQLYEDKQQNDVSTDNAADPMENNVTHPSGRVTRITPARTAKRNNSSSTLPARTSKRLKGATLETKNDQESGVVQEKQVSEVNAEKQPEENQISYQLEDDHNWTDQCLDFAVKTLTSEIITREIPGNVREELETGVNKTPTNVN